MLLTSLVLRNLVRVNATADNISVGRRYPKYPAKSFPDLKVKTSKTKVIKIDIIGTSIRSFLSKDATMFIGNKISGKIAKITIALVKPYLSLYRTKIANANAKANAIQQPILRFIAYPFSKKGVCVIIQKSFKKKTYNTQKLPKRIEVQSSTQRNHDL